ncbi:MAG: stage III sporulation protein AD [Oscillospiraceae bacterium]|nr:stage III sporulation protein AD [Oscillospiraceae bacterium]
MDTGISVAATALIAVIVLSVLKKNGPEFVIPVVLAAGGCMIYFALDALGRIGASVVAFVRTAQIEPWVVEPVVKVVGVSLVTKVTSEVCRGVGEGGIAAFADTAGTVIALACTLPLARAVMNMVVGVLG